MLFSNPPKLGISIDENLVKLNTYANIFHRCTVLLGCWAADTPEVEIKIMIGNHIYKDAIAIQALQTRIRTLGQDSDSSLLPSDHWLKLFVALTEAPNTLVRLYGMYYVLKKELLEELRCHIDQTDAVWDEPTVIILEQIGRELEQEISSAKALLDQVNRMFYSSMMTEKIRNQWDEITSRALSTEQPRLPAPSIPARDNRFRVVEQAPFAEVGDPHGTAILLHTMLMSIEIATIEVCGRMISDFQSMPFDFVLDMSRQCWDESRHSLLCYNRIQQLGAKIGQFPVDNQLWDLSYNLPVELRLAVHQRIGEWLGADGAMLNAAKLRDAGDQLTARIFDYVAADELTHVGFGNKWIRHILADDSVKVKEVHERAIQHRRRSGKTISGPPNIPFNRHACQVAGFTPGEINELQEARKSGAIHNSDMS